MTVETEPSEIGVDASQHRDDRQSLLRTLVGRPIFWLSGGFLLLVVAASAAASLIAPYGPEISNFQTLSEGPSLTHLLGTDDLGRDVLSRLLFGGRVTLLGAAEAIVTFVIVGVPFGLMAGYLRPRVDRLVMSAIDVVLSMPVIILLLVVGALFNGNLALMITLGVVASPGIVRVVRAATLAVRSELYVKAAEVVGLSRFQILRRHVLPRVLGPILVQVSVFAAAAVAIESTLGFLGLDVNPPAPSWGSMVAEGATQINQQPWLIVPSGLTIALTVLAIGLLGDTIRDALSRNGAKTPRRTGLRRSRPSNTETTPFEASSSDVVEKSGDAPLLSVRNLSVTLRRELVMIDNVNFDLQKGETLGIVGESGSGKTLTILALLGLLPDGLEVSSGRVAFASEELLTNGTFKSQVRGREIDFVSQDPMSALDPGCTVGNQLREAVRRNLGVGRVEGKARAIELLRLVDLPSPEWVARRFPHELSGGMAQRVCIALALSGSPSLLIADEPTTALDVTVQAEILDLLRSLRERREMSLIIVSHDWGVIADSCDRTLVMYAGEVVELALIEDLFSNPRHPYTEALLAANPHLVTDGPFPSIPGGVPVPEDWPLGCRFEPRCRYAQPDCSISPIQPVAISLTHLARCLHSESVGEALLRDNH